MKRVMVTRKARFEADPDYERMFKQRAVAHQLKSRYGLTVANAESMYNQQEGRCAICLRPGACPTTVAAGSAGKLNVDHCHETGIVRGLLCAQCNTAIGKMNDNSERLRRAADYLEGR